jgi:hypothetical protein
MRYRVFDVRITQPHESYFVRWAVLDAFGHSVARCMKEHEAREVAEGLNALAAVRILIEQAQINEQRAEGAEKYLAEEKTAVATLRVHMAALRSEMALMRDLLSRKQDEIARLRNARALTREERLHSLPSPDRSRTKVKA